MATDVMKLHPTPEEIITKHNLKFSRYFQNALTTKYTEFMDNTPSDIDPRLVTEVYLKMYQYAAYTFYPSESASMNSLIFLGGKEKSTLKEMAETLGKETIDTFNTGESRGREVSHSLNYQKLGKELMSVDELAVMDGGMCILQLRGVRPFLSRKYDITKHPNYRYLSDADPRNAFDIADYNPTIGHLFVCQLRRAFRFWRKRSEKANALFG